jgi:glycosyltransferase involved in cell wall biosynthesis
MMNKFDKLSVIMSVYNSEENLSDSIESILNQTYKNFEFLIMDDGSSDNSSEILDEYAKEDNRVKIFKNSDNLGLTKSLNILLSSSKGEYLARQDSDDISSKDRFEKQLNYLSLNKLDACTVRALGSTTKKLIPNVSYYFPLNLVIKFKNPFVHGSLLVRKNVMESLGGYDENFYYSQDYKLMSDLLSRNFKVKIMPDILYFLNQENNISTNNKEEQKYYADCVRKNKTPKT